MDMLMIIGRILFGGYFIYSGFNHLTRSEMLAEYAKAKKIPAPRAAVVLSGLMILVGGVGVLFAVFMPIALGLIASFLFLVTFTMHNFWADKDPILKINNRINFGKNLALLGACLLMIALLLLL